MPWRASRQPSAVSRQPSAVHYNYKKSDKPSEFIAILLSCYFSILKALNRT
ncbi:hypothetical protein ACGMNB_06505 [Shewanella oncorhynchi]|uniref:hypothetical protein n=1 Tax=Shewanella oncorhynchi TaxID=2726434 RepID=UPI0037451DF5